MYLKYTYTILDTRRIRNSSIENTQQDLVFKTRIKLKILVSDKLRYFTTLQCHMCQL